MACSIYFFYLFHIYFHSQEVKGKLDLQNRTIVVFQSIPRGYNFMELLRSTIKGNIFERLRAYLCDVSQPALICVVLI